MKTKLDELNEEIVILQKKKEKVLLEQEIEKIKKTVIEETIIKRVIKEEDCPYIPTYPYHPLITWRDGTNYVLC